MCRRLAQVRGTTETHSNASYFKCQSEGIRQRRGCLSIPTELCLFLPKVRPLEEKKHFYGLIESSVDALHCLAPYSPLTWPPFAEEASLIEFLHQLQYDSAVSARGESPTHRAI